MTPFMRCTQLSHTARVGILFVLVTLVLLFHEVHEGHIWQRPLTERELHEKGLWRSPKLAVDGYILKHSRSADQWHVLLIQRTRDPYKGHWALPGGFVVWKEAPEDAVRREVLEETHLVVDPQVPPAFVNFRGGPDRDPRTHTVSVGYACKVTAESLSMLQRDDDAGDAAWFPLEEAANGTSPRIAFDHDSMLREFADWFEAVGRKKGLYVEVD